jgi:hypothetical protein
MEEGEFFPFLDFPEAESEELLLAKWGFLAEHFEVSKVADTRFLLRILYWIKGQNRDATALVRPSRVWDLYMAIDARHLLCLEAEKAQDLRKIR